MPEAGARPKVLFIAREHVGHWVPLYAEAFKAACDTITIGPPIDTEGLRFARRERLLAALEPNDIRTEILHLPDMLPCLPDGWRPDLIVAVQSAAPVSGLQHAPCPTAYLSIDTWHDKHEFAAARNYDFVFCAQRAFLPCFEAAGARNVSWLPLAASPHHHYPVAQEPVADVAFIGAIHFLADAPRYVRLQELSKRFRLLLESSLGAVETCNAYSLARLAFNQSVSREINMRVFEVLAMGRPLITNRDAEENGLFELFTEGEHLATYANDEELFAQVAHYLAHPEAARKMGARGREVVLAAHTYAHRVQTILDTVLGSGLLHPAQIAPPETLVAQLPFGPGRTLDIGAQLERSRVALRRCGVTRLDAAAPAGGARSGSYDSTLPWPCAPPDAAYDTVVAGDPRACFGGLDAAAAWCAKALVPGGTLLWRTGGAESDAEKWRALGATHGLHLTGARPCAAGSGMLGLRFRRFRQRDDDLRAEIEARFPLPNPADYGMALAEEQPPEP